MHNYPEVRDGTYHWLASKVAAVACLILCWVLTSSCVLLPLSMIRPKYFVSSEEMSPECLAAVFDYIKLISGGWDVREDTYPDRVRSVTSVIKNAFVVGEVVVIDAQKTDESPRRLLKFYFSRRGDRLAAVLIQAVVIPGKSGGAFGWTSLSNDITGGNIQILKCRGPFVGQDVEIGKDPVSTDR